MIIAEKHERHNNRTCALIPATPTNLKLLLRREHDIPLRVQNVGIRPLLEGVSEREDPRRVNVLVVRNHGLKLLLELLEVRAVTRAGRKVHHTDRAQNPSVRCSSVERRRGAAGAFNH